MTDQKLHARRATCPRARRPGGEPSGPVTGWRSVLRGARLPLAALLVWLPLAATGAGTLQVTGSLWSPYMDNDLPEGGLAADLVRTALTRAGYEIEPSIETWTRAYRGTEVGVYDVVAAIWESPEREEALLFSEPYLLNDIVLLARRGVLVEFDTLSDLTGLRIGVVREYAYDEDFDHHPGLRKVVNDHLIQNLLLLRQGRLDVVVADKWALLHQISTFMPDDIGGFYLLPKPLARRALRLGVSRQNPDAEKIVAAFNAAITAMRADGTYEAIVGKHTKGIAVLPSQR